ncbi:MAG TPA: hypothetical protein EYP85_01905 [Armatimonadetes bacterium]|nr:hypothetical protein [Armatimonadota bacterium]
MGEIMHTLGCVEALNLDGGGSLALYYNDNFVLHPGRELVSILTVD